MRKAWPCIAAILLLYACSSVTPSYDSLEGKWMYSDTSVNMMLIFRHDSMWLHYPTSKGSMTDRERQMLDSMDLEYNTHKYTIESDTIKYMKVIFMNVLDSISLKNARPDIFVIRKLTDDSLVMSQWDWNDTLRFYKISNDV